MSAPPDANPLDPPARAGGLKRSAHNSLRARNKKAKTASGLYLGEHIELYDSDHILASEEDTDTDIEPESETESENGAEGEPQHAGEGGIEMDLNGELAPELLTADHEAGTADAEDIEGEGIEAAYQNEAGDEDELYDEAGAEDDVLVEYEPDEGSPSAPSAQAPPSAQGQAANSLITTPARVPKPRRRYRAKGPTRLRKDRPVQAEVPLDVWANILSFCPPRFLARARRLNTSFRDLLVYSTIWQHSRQEYHGVDMPAPFPGMKEDEYASLLDGLGCMECGNRKTRKTYWVWRKRWCVPCFETSTVKVMLPFFSFLPLSRAPSPLFSLSLSISFGERPLQLIRSR